MDRILGWRISAPLFACTVERDFTIDHNPHERVSLCVLELDDSMTIPRKLSPSACFLPVLFNGLVFVTADFKCNLSSGAGGSYGAQVQTLPPHLLWDSSSTARRSTLAALRPALGTGLTCSASHVEDRVGPFSLLLEYLDSLGCRQD